MTYVDVNIPVKDPRSDYLQSSFDSDQAYHERRKFQFIRSLTPTRNMPLGYLSVILFPLLVSCAAANSTGKIKF